MFFIFTILQTTVYSQIFKGKVLDEKTEEAPEYANIGVVGKNIGGISFENGEFSIDLSGADGQDGLDVKHTMWHCGQLGMLKESLMKDLILA